VGAELRALPPFNLEHLQRLTDDHGIIQHATYSVPNRKTGYCTDDNSRALVVAAQRYSQSGDRELLRLAAHHLPIVTKFVSRAEEF